MQIKHVTWIRFTTGRTFQDEGDLTIRDGVLGEIVINDQCIHAVFHEPLTHRCAGVRSEILVGGIVSRSGRNDDRVFQRATGFERSNRADNVRTLLADRDVDRVNRTEFRVATGETNFVDLRLIENGVDRDGRLARTAVADDQFALTAPDRNHGVDRHDAGEERLVNRFTLDNTGSDFFDGI